MNVNFNRQILSAVTTDARVPCIGRRSINRKTFYPENPVLLPAICTRVLYVRLHVCRARNPDAPLQRVAITRPLRGREGDRKNAKSERI